ncbi:MAG: DUF362 domain-containing protein [Thermoflexales bacterium]|nr:DUF362 domain-containing protein [Thermoflexales bacterium]
MGNHPIYSRDASVHLTTGLNKFDALQRAIDDSGFLNNLQAAWQASGKAKGDFVVGIKPNIMTAAFRDPNSPIYTDPELVEALIDAMRDNGFRRFAIVEAENVYNYSYQGRRVKAVAEMVGYDEAHGYQIHSLTEDKVPFDYGFELGKHFVGRAWRDCDYRISFAKNKTHWQCYYTACIKNLYGALPMWDKMKWYHGHTPDGHNIEFSDAAVLSAHHFPANFGFMDAWWSADGLTGHVRDGVPNETRTIFASSNILALDWVAGEKMGLDPMRNAVIARGVRQWGRVAITRVGDMTPWQPWLNVVPAMVEGMDIGEEWYHISAFFSHSLAEAQDPRFKPTDNGPFFTVMHGVLASLDALTTQPAPTGEARLHEMLTREDDHPDDESAQGDIEVEEDPRRE